MLTSEYLESVVARYLPAARAGQVATYIPGLAAADPEQLGVCWMDQDGQVVTAGRWQEAVTVQSIVKVAVFLQALADCPMERLAEKG